MEIIQYFSMELPHKIIQYFSMELPHGNHSIFLNGVTSCKASNGSHWTQQSCLMEII